MSLLLNMLSRLVTAFLPRSRYLNSMAAVTVCSEFGPPKIKSLTVSIVSLPISHEVMVFTMLVFMKCLDCKNSLHASSNIWYISPQHYTGLLLVHL